MSTNSSQPRATPDATFTPNVLTSPSVSLAGLKRPTEPNLVHGRILYLEDVSVSFDGFKAINHLVDIFFTERHPQFHDDRFFCLC